MSKEIKWIRLNKNIINDDGINLFLFHHAGGSGNYFRQLAKELESSNINVYAYSLPSKAPKGRVYSNVNDIVNQLYETIMKVEDVKSIPAVFMGHSLGGIIAFELSRLLKDSAIHLKALILSAVRNPNLLTALNQDPNVIKRHMSNDKDFIDYFRSIGGLPEGLDSEMLQLTMSWIRDDYKAFETYQIKDHSKVECPLFVISGQSDPSVSPASVIGWFSFSNHLNNISNEPTIMEGSHFYLNEPASKNLFKEKLISICKGDTKLLSYHSEELPPPPSNYCIAKNEISTFLTDIDNDNIVTSEAAADVDTVVQMRRDRPSCYSFIEKKVTQPV